LKLHTFQLESLDETDIPQLINLSDSVGWDYDEHEIRTILSSGLIFGHINEDGQIISSAAIIPYDTKVASIGMVIVHKDYRGYGLGKIVTQACIDAVPKETSIMLIATNDGKPLYNKMGFTEVDYIHKFICEDYNISNDSCDNLIQTMQPSDIKQMIEQDMLSFGDKREKFLINRFKQSHECLVVKDNSQNIIGYGLSILGPKNLILGPIVAPNPDIAAKLVNQLAKKHKGKLRIDVPSGNEPFMNWLVDKGFMQVTQPPIMILNSNRMPNRNKTLYGIASQALG
jgi:N-acetylglutamate synthase-like GNAT family acetyltransferase